MGEKWSVFFSLLTQNNPFSFNNFVLHIFHDPLFYPDKSRFVDMIISYSNG